MPRLHLEEGAREGGRTRGAVNGPAPWQGCELEITPPACGAAVNPTGGGWSWLRSHPRPPSVPLPPSAAGSSCSGAALPSTGLSREGFYLVSISVLLLEVKQQEAPRCDLKQKS